MNNEFINAFSKSAKADRERINEEVKIMREGIAEALYISLKEEGNDVDGYTANLNLMYNNLTDGYYDFNGPDGKPVKRWKPYHQQHAILKTMIEGMQKYHGDNLAFDLSLDGLKRLGARRTERKSKRVITSHNNGLTLESTRPQLEYAGHLNDRGEYQFAGRN
jgi:hypothetical protein